MLNMKKSLALVLAAATAFTFAPVANLGVTANASQTQVQTYNLVGDDVKTPLSAATAFEDLSDGTDNSACVARSFSSLTLALKVKVVKDHTYQVYGFNNVENVYCADTLPASVPTKGADNKITYTGMKSTPDQSKVKDTDDSFLYFAVDLTSVNGGSFKLMDSDQSKENSFSNITVNIANPKGVTGFQSTTLANIIDTDGSTVINPTNGITGGKSYDLTMNTSANPYYLGISLGTVTSWTGETDTVKKAVAKSLSGGAAWVNPDSNAGSLTSTITSDYTYTDTAGTVKNPSSGATVNKSAFIVKTAHSDLTQLYVDFFNNDGKPLGTETINYTVARSNHAIDWIKWNTEKNTEKVDTTTAPTATATTKTVLGWKTDGKDAYILQKSVWKGSSADTADYTHKMDPYAGKNATITVKSESDQVTFVSTDTRIVDVTADKDQPYVAKVTAKTTGTATINIFVGSTNNNKGKLYILPVQVAENGDDVIATKDSANILGNEETDTINLDATDQTAAGAVKEDVVTFTSQGGLKFDKVSVGGDTSAVTVSQTDGVVTVKSNKTKAQLATPAVANITMTSKTETGKNVMGTSKTITVVVWAKPAAQFTVDPVFLSLSDPTQNTKILKTNPDTFTNVSWSIVDNQATSTTLADDGNEAITLTNDTTNSNTQHTAKVIAKKFGTATVKALVSETATTRKTAKTAKVVVGSAQANKITVSSASSLTMTEGDTAQIDAKATTGTVKFESGNTAVASVTTGGAVTAVKAGATTIKVTAEGADPVFVPVVVNAKPVVYADPAQVKGVKVSNKKGAKVTVKYTKDTTAPTVKYYVQKKVSGKTAGKSVGSTKTTLSVKKGATVKVRVKAYYYDANGVKHVGAYSSWKTLKTDKK